MAKRLTAAMLDRLKPDPEKRLEINDDLTPGLQIRVGPSGTKSWSFAYKVAGAGIGGKRGKNSRMSLGIYPLVGLAEARQKAADARDLSDRGIDPKAEKNAEITRQMTSRVDALIGSYIEFKKGSGIKQWKSIETLLKSTVAKRWAGVSIDTVQRAQIHHYLDELVSRNQDGKAKEVRRHMSIFMNWCVDRGHILASPMAGMNRQDLSYKPRERVLNIEEISQIWKASFEIGYPFGPMVRLLILTGQRLREIAELQRSWLDEDRFEIPADSYKTKVAQVVPLVKSAQQEIAKIPVWNRGEFCLSTSNGEKPVSGFSKAKLRFDKRLELNHWTFHDLRRSVATHMASLGVLQEHIERVLGHVIPGVAGTYNRHSYFDQKLQALTIWESHLIDSQCTTVH